MDVSSLPDLKGYVAHLSKGDVDILRSSDAVAYIEKDSIVKINDMKDTEIEEDAPWGLTRISHRSNPSTEKVHHDFPHYKNGGEDVTVRIFLTPNDNCSSFKLKLYSQSMKYFICFLILFLNFFNPFRFLIFSLLEIRLTLLTQV